MNIEKEQDCMRVCYKHWQGNNKDNLDTKQLSIITYAMLLEIINKPDGENLDADHYIEKAKEVYQKGLNNGWMMTH